MKIIREKGKMIKISHGIAQSVITYMRKRSLNTTVSAKKYLIPSMIDIYCLIVAGRCVIKREV
jgi:hypothetical protein